MERFYLIVVPFEVAFYLGVPHHAHAFHQVQSYSYHFFNHSFCHFTYCFRSHVLFIGAHCTSKFIPITYQ